MKAVAIARVNLRRMLRDRSNIFFVFVFPIAIILLIGAQFGGDVEPAVGTFSADDGVVAASIVRSLQESGELEVFVYPSEEAVTRAVERGQIQAGVLMGPGLDDQVARALPIEVGFITRPDGFGAQLQTTVGAAVSTVMTPITAAQFAGAHTDATFEEALALAQSDADVGGAVQVETTTVGEAIFPASLGRFDLGASQQLVLFVFLTALSGSAALIMTRQLGISTRMLSTPTSVTAIVLGEGAGRWGVAMVQGLYIVGATILLFRVNWGSPMAALTIIVVFSAVGAGAGMLVGSIVSNEQQASGIAIVLSLGLAALGGAMLPSELFSPTMQQISHLTPHAWALDGFAELVRHDGSLVDVLPEIGVLVAYAAVLFAIASTTLRRAITRA